MLHEKLEAASRETHRRRLRFGLAAGGVAALLALFVFGVIRVDLAMLGLAPGEAPGEPVPPERVSVAPPAGAPAAPRLAPAAPVVSDPAPTARPAPSVEMPSTVPEPDLAARQRFMDVLAAFERDLEPQIADPAFGVWDDAFQAAVPARKAAALQRFATGDYAAAEAALDALTNDAAAALTARDAAFDDALAAARSAADADDVDRAVRAIGEALRLKPDDAGAAALQARIEALPPLLDLIRRAAVARTENDLETEAALLDEAVTRDPSRRALVERLDTVRREISERRYAGHVEAGLGAVETRDLAGARRALGRAKEMFAQRAETKLLQGRVDRLAREIEIARLAGLAEAAAATDDWPGARRRYAELAKLLPGDEKVGAAIDLADTILDTTGRIDHLLASPDRLAAANIAAEARVAIDAARVPAALSPALATKRDALQEALSLWTAAVPVAVVSDGATAISVRGVGQVGVTTGRTIELKPGRYTFEGARAGYRSKLVSVEIPPGATGITVEVVCDEPV